MSKLKEKIREAVMEYHNEKDVVADPEVLIEAICEEIKEYLNGIVE